MHFHQKWNQDFCLKFHQARIQPGSVVFRLFQPEPLASNEGAKIRARRFSILARLVFRPTVERCLAPASRISLFGIWPKSCASLVIGVDLAGNVSLAISVLAQCGI